MLKEHNVDLITVHFDTQDTNTLTMVCNLKPFLCILQTIALCCCFVHLLARIGTIANMIGEKEALIGRMRIAIHTGTASGRYVEP